MKVVERVLEKMLCRIVSVGEVQFGFIPEGGTIDAVFILRRMQEIASCQRITAGCVICGLDKAFDRVPRKVLE